MRGRHGRQLLQRRLRQRFPRENTNGLAVGPRRGRSFVPRRERWGALAEGTGIRAGVARGAASCGSDMGGGQRQRDDQAVKNGVLNETASLLPPVVSLSAHAAPHPAAGFLPVHLPVIPPTPLYVGASSRAHCGAGWQQPRRNGRKELPRASLPTHCTGRGGLGAATAQPKPWERPRRARHSAQHEPGVHVKSREAAAYGPGPYVRRMPLERI
jgi:hypothetical protein